MAAAFSPSPGTRLIGIGFVVLLHAAVIYALVTGLAYRAVDIIRAPVETEIIAPQKPEQPPPPPPPPLQFAPPPPAFVPLPEIQIEKPPPPQSTAITAVTPVKPVAPPPPAAPAAEPARVLPRIDARHSQEPDYPPTSRRLGEQGSLILQVLVDVDGRVIDEKLLQSSGYDRLDQAALDGVKGNYRFLPGTVDGKPQQMWYTFKFTWKLR
ncbi:MAG TPA: TonB family protein [Stellaceae bacterium]|nr:TonB family protein [Stellaceae bacterium]